MGLPNAGKSTFSAATTAAKPKIADYAFTTLAPQLGVVAVDGTEFVLADLPGLIEGAHEGVGLGDRFLGHIERCSVVLHLIDGTEATLTKSYRTIRSELEAYGHDLARKPEIVGLNKADAIPPALLKRKIAALEKASGAKVFALSAATGDGVTPVLRALRARIGKAAKVSEPSKAWTP